MRHDGNSLHPYVYFVGDEPSKKNVSTDVPFVGTTSYLNLLRWIGLLHLDIARIKIFNQVDNPFPAGSERFINDGLKDKRIKVVALGNKAADYLRESGVSEYYVLPHPSPKNRKLNQKTWLKRKLQGCKEYIYG